jgi:signal transduction histidine kinase
MELALFRISEEALSNIRGHSESPLAVIDLMVDGSQVPGRIKDYAEA